MYVLIRKFLWLLKMRKKSSHEWKSSRIMNLDWKKDFVCAIFSIKIIKKNLRTERERGFAVALGLRNEMKLERKNNISWCHPTIVKSLRICHMNQNKYWLLYLFHELLNINVAHIYFLLSCSRLPACFFYILTSEHHCALWSKRNKLLNSDEAFVCL